MLNSIFGGHWFLERGELNFRNKGVRKYNRYYTTIDIVRYNAKRRFYTSYREACYDPVLRMASSSQRSDMRDVAASWLVSQTCIYMFSDDLVARL